MATRRKPAGSSSPDAAPAENPQSADTELAGEPGPELVTFPAEPVHTFKLLPSGDEPVRAGGHVLTDRGWIPETQVGEAGS